jgi:transcriptional regulator with GAF, ATPase, and Fis domain
MAWFVYKNRIGNQPEERYRLRKALSTVGTERSHDVVVEAAVEGVQFSFQLQGNTHEVMPVKGRVRINGQAVSRKTAVRSCDRIEWEGGMGIFLESDSPPETQVSPNLAHKALEVLQSLAVTLQKPGGVSLALDQILEVLVEMSGAEEGYLLSEIRADGGWELLASRERPDRKQLFSSTLIREALEKREMIYVENMIGHPWAENGSVIEARIFSAACIPLRVDDSVRGVLYLLSRSPGRSIQRQSLDEIRLLATQASLMLASRRELNAAQRENQELRQWVREWPSSLVFDPEKSPMREVARKIQKLAPSPLSILILGETGTGKELIAKEIHRQSDRAHGPFVAVNCAAIPGPLLESILFGHERGAFTGAVKAHAGKFMAADKGTIFLDEVGDLPEDLQAKLLRVLQERIVEPIGARQAVPVDVRIVAATHLDLDDAIKRKRFRQDLYFRLGGSTVRLPALRDRLCDLPLLCRFFLEQLSCSKVLSKQAEGALSTHSWPGNVRELQQVISRAALLAEGSEIQPSDLELASSSVGGGGSADQGVWLSTQIEDFRSLEQAQLAFTRDLVKRALAKSGGDRTRTAALLGISERTLYRILSARES